MTEQAQETKAPELKVSDFKLGLKAARLYEELFGVPDPIQDLVQQKRTWELIAVSKKPSTLESYYAFRESDEFDDMADLAPEVIAKLFKDVEPKKD